MKIFVLLLLTIASAFAGELGFTKRDDRVVLTQAGRPLAEYVFRDARIPRPYFTKLHAPDGTQLTRNHPPVKGADATDHDTLHPGLWLAFSDLNGVDFWRNKGRIEHVHFVREPRVEGGRLTLAVEEQYVASDGREICRGVNEFTFVAGDALTPSQPGTLLLWSTTLRRAEGPMVFGPQHEMGLGFRIATPLVVKGGTGRIVSSHGGENEAGNWGRAGAWWDYSGTLAGKHAGILALAAADNALPVWSHARDYGVLALNPTGPPPGAKDVPSVPFTIPKGQPMRMRFGLLLHSTAAPFDVAKAAQSVDTELKAWKADAEPAAKTGAATVPRAVPTFECMGLYWDVPEGAATKTCAVKFRATGEGQWRHAQALWFDTKRKQYRGSVVHLRAGTEYEFTLALADGPTASVKAATWNNTFPIAATVTLPNGTTHEPLRITEGGSPSGYRLYTAAPEGTTIDVADAADTCVSVEADYVIVRGLTCRGARVDGVRMGNRRNVVIEGCDISAWGRRDAKAGQTVKLGGKEVKFPENLGAYLDAGIQVGGPLSARACEQIVIQGNRIHHPRWTANNWTQASPYFSTGGKLSTHPQGPDAIVFAQQTHGRHVIRWNEIFSDLDHMFYDALLAAEPKGNGFIGDGDIYGNHISDCWDDGIEAERGDRNVRIWGNHFSWMIKCVSAGYIWEGPLYVWRNVAEDLLHSNEMPAHNGRLSPFAAHPPCFMPPPQEDPKERRDGVVFVYHNSLLAGTGTGAAAGWAFNAWHLHKYISPTVRLISRNNVWLTRAYPAYWNTPNPQGVNYGVRDFDRSYFDQDYDLHNGVIAPAATAGAHTRQAGPVFSQTHRFQLAENSPGHDDALRLPNFNDDHLGTAPDRGAHETGAADARYGTVLWREVLRN